MKYLMDRQLKDLSDPSGLTQTDRNRVLRADRQCS